MPFYHIILLALIQGITEFLPVSSSGHLGLYHCFTDQCDTWDSANVMMDIAVHLGTLGAVLLYFRRDVFTMISGAFSIAQGKTKGQDSKLLLFVLMSSVPVILVGLAIHAYQPDWLKTLYMIAWMTLIFGFVLWWADAKTKATRKIEDMNFKDALFVGAMQVLALIPGVSRSGITMTAARFLGFSREEAARYSMLLAMVAISGAGALLGLDIVKGEGVSIGFDIILAIVLSFISSYFTLLLMMRFLEKFTFTGFAIYRIAMGGLLLALLYGGVITG